MPTVYVIMGGLEALAMADEDSSSGSETMNFNEWVFGVVKAPEEAEAFIKEATEIASKINVMMRFLHEREDAEYDDNDPDLTDEQAEEQLKQLKEQMLRLDLKAKFGKGPDLDIYYDLVYWSLEAEMKSVFPGE